MTQYIDKDALVVEIDNILDYIDEHWDTDYAIGAQRFADKLQDAIDTLEVKEVDLKKLGEIARHLIAVKEHIEDMRLDKEEWLMLEKIGYPERFKAQKGE